MIRPRKLPQPTGSRFTKSWSTCRSDLLTPPMISPRASPRVFSKRRTVNCLRKP
jgi:hypothetical protein